MEYSNENCPRPAYPEQAKENGAEGDRTPIIAKPYLDFSFGPVQEPSKLSRHIFGINESRSPPGPRHAALFSPFISKSYLHVFQETRCFLKAVIVRCQANLAAFSS